VLSAEADGATPDPTYPWIQFWDGNEKPPPSDAIDIAATSWSPTAGASCLWVEALQAVGEVTITMRYELAGVVIATDSVKLGFVKTSLWPSSAESYGSDSPYGIFRKTDNEDPITYAPAHTNPSGNEQLYPWVSVDANNQTTCADVHVVPMAYAPYVNFSVLDDSKADVALDPAEPGNLETFGVKIIGKAEGKTQVGIRLGTPSGAEGNRLNVACYRLCERPLLWVDVESPTCDVPELIAEDIPMEANRILAQAVVSAPASTPGSELWAEMDASENFDLNGNGTLDWDTSLVGEGMQLLEWADAHYWWSSELLVLHVRELVWHPGGGDPQSLIGLHVGKSSSPFSRPFIIISDCFVGSAMFPDSWSGGLAHEVMHEFGLSHTGPSTKATAPLSPKNVANLMQMYLGHRPTFIGCYPVERVKGRDEGGTEAGESYTPKIYDWQWDQVVRP